MENANQDTTTYELEFRDQSTGYWKRKATVRPDYFREAVITKVRFLFFFNLVNEYRTITNLDDANLEARRFAIQLGGEYLIKHKDVRVLECEYWPWSKTTYKEVIWKNGEFLDDGE